MDVSFRDVSCFERSLTDCVDDVDALCSAFVFRREGVLLAALLRNYSLGFKEELHLMEVLDREWEELQKQNQLDESPETPDTGQRTD